MSLRNPRSIVLCAIALAASWRWMLRSTAMYSLAVVARAQANPDPSTRS